jgi:transcriptional regulator with XRE-family HTH domain
LAKGERDRLARKLCDLLIEARLASGLNQGQIGKAVDRSQSFVSNYERGHLPDLILLPGVRGGSHRASEATFVVPTPGKIPPILLD